jgi:trk system potassium uptake protein TrkH
MTTIATGGFSTSDASLGHFASARIDAIGTVFMLMGGLPFVLYLRAVRGNPGALWYDSQVRCYLIVAASAITMMTTYLCIKQGVGVGQALRLAAFNVVSVMTGTGYATVDFGLWGSFAVTFFVFLMFVGGCAGSTTCGIKIFRFQILYATAVTQLRRLLEPHGVFIAYYNGKPIADSVGDSVMTFFALYVLSFATVAIGLGLMGLDFVTAVSGAATSISNVGPGLGDVIGPAGSFVSLPDGAKWLLSLAMLMGRLELFTVLVMLAPAFWHR